tara:strand:+ start:270 stop:731 length:462 start_codon:yes stop_codon:yes gene_type:complete
MSKNNYSNGKIYKIYDNTNSDVYFGSTTQSLARRIALHRYHAKIGKTIKSNSIILNGDYSISLVEQVCCQNKEQLHARERHYIENYPCLNKNIPGRSKKEYDDDHKEEYKLYYLENKERIKEYCDSRKQIKSEYDKKRYSDLKTLEEGDHSNA